MNRPGPNPVLADCKTCKNYVGRLIEHCSEYRYKPDFECQKHVVVSPRGVKTPAAMP